MGEINKYLVFTLFFFLFFESFAYRLKDEDVTVVDGVIISCSYNISTHGNIIDIPDFLGGQTITGIGDYAFPTGNGKITELTLPATLVTIGNGAFAGHALTSIVIPSGVTYIGYAAFANNAIGSVDLPAGLEFLGSSVFENNQLTSVTIPDGITEIGYGAFRNNQITSVSLPDGLLTIEGEAFWNNQIENITLPSGLQRIDWGAFSQNKISSLAIPNSVVTIDDYAFSNNLISVLTFDAGCQLEEISQRCFSNNNIQNLIIPSSILEIDEQAFYDNPNLINVTFGSNLLRIKQWAFWDCNLSSLNLPESLVFIGRYSFGNNNNLNGISLPTSVNNYIWNDSNGNQHNEGDNVSDFYNSYVARVEYTLKPEDVVVDNGIITQCIYFDDIANVGSVITIPDNIDGQNIVGIGDGVFYDCGILDVIFPQGIQSIGASAFQENEIVNLTIPNSLVSIGEQAFHYNVINTITFEATSSLERIGRHVFSSNRLQDINFPQSVAIIGKDAFSNNDLQNVTFEASSSLVSIGSRAFEGNWQLTNITLPDPKLTGYSDHWVDWDNIEYSTNLVIDKFESFYKIPIEHTLAETDSIEVVDGVIISYTPTNPYINILTIPNSIDGQEIIGIGQNVFANMGLIGVNLPPSLNFIGNWAFGENEIVEIFIPASVEEIHGSAFSRNNINDLYFEDNSSLRRIEWDAFSQNKISQVTLPDSLNYIGSYAFGWNEISNDLIIPDSVEYIDYGAFLGNQIPSVIFTENSLLSYLGERAFASNQISNEIFIPYGLTEISSYAFEYNNISKVITHEDIVEYGTGAFQYNDPNLEIILHTPPTIPLVTYFFWWKDNYGNYYDPGEIITNGGILDFENRYKAVIDQFFVVKFIVTDDNNVPLENASIEIFGETLITDVNGIDSIGPVLRGVREYTVSGITGCYDYSSSIDVQDDMTVYVALIRYYNVDINVLNDADGSPIEGADISIGGLALTSDLNGNAKISLSDGNYPTLINANGYKAYSDSTFIQDTDTLIVVRLMPVEINYFANDKTADSYTETSKGSDYTVNTNSYTRPAYTFLHWNTSNDDSGVSYTENELITLEYSDIDLYAIWSPIDYTIIYHLDGGTNDASNPATYNVESEFDFLPGTKPTLYFATWLDADNNRVAKIEKGSTGNIELWAVFTPEPTYYLDYHNLENASHNNQASYTQFDLPFTFEDAYKRGYEFIGWHEDSLLTQQITTIPVGSELDYDIYASWGGAIVYALAYELGGGTNSSANPAEYTIESNTVVFEEPTKIGGKFTGWYNDSGFTSEITELPNGSIGDTTLYAQWDLDTFDIGYELNGGANHINNPGIYTIDSDNILFEAPAKVGEKFMGWYIDSGFTTEITDLPTGSYGDTTLYAQWELDTFDIQYDIDGGANHIANPSTYTIESANILFEIPYKLGANFVGWYIDSIFTTRITEIPTGSIGDTTLYAEWNLDGFAIQYELNGGINAVANPLIYTIESNTIVFETPAKLGATFTGWYIDSGFTTEITDLPTGSYGDTTLYAQWELINYDIEYVLDSGTNHLLNPAQYTIESNTIVFEEPTKAGSKFIAWFNDASLTSETTELPTGSYGDTILYAKWELDTFDIQYVLDGGINNPLNPAQYTIESNIISFEVPDKAGFYFDGWYTNSDYSAGISSILQGSIGDVILYAKWREIFTVHFVITADGANPAKDVDIVINNSEILRSDIAGFADTLVPDKSSFDYSVEIDGIVIEEGYVNVSGGDVTVKVEIVDCYMRWYDVIFCDNGKGLWTDFVWYKDNVKVSPEQFFHNPGGIENGKYRLVVTSRMGVEYIWEKEYETDEFAVNVYPNPVQKSGQLNVDISGEINLQNSTIIIYNIAGTLLNTINNPMKMNDINIDDRFSPGLYHIVIMEDKNKRRAVKQFIVN